MDNSYLADSHLGPRHRILRLENSFQFDLQSLGLRFLRSAAARSCLEVVLHIVAVTDFLIVILLHFMGPPPRFTLVEIHQSFWYLQAVHVPLAVFHLDFKVAIMALNLAGRAAPRLELLLPRRSHCKVDALPCRCLLV